MSPTSKSAKIPKPIKIKKEKTEEDRAIHSMTHYVGDRLELVKQIFGSLKTKTITNLAPEYLKEKEMNEIQELCLNELLCLSTKRLLSIINATKCPTDTESSDDSDVEAKEEHISLEEISSESEMENGGKTAKKSGSQTRTKRNTKKPNQADEKPAGDGQISVLELLELQARARAIRSQLALEPVTKIEVDSDDEQSANANVSSTTKEQKTSRKRKKTNGHEEEKLSSSPTSSTATTKQQQQHPGSNSSAINEKSNEKSRKLNKTSNVTQKIKLKRNFRTNNQESLEADSSELDQTNNLDKIGIIKELKQEKRSRTPSPDVIPIEPEPETLLISDSASETEAERNLKKKLTNRQVIENSTASQAITLTAPTPATVSEVTSSPPPPPPPPPPQEIEEAEDGEIIENENEDDIQKSPVVSTNDTVNLEEANSGLYKSKIITNDAQLESESKEESGHRSSVGSPKAIEENIEQEQGISKTSPAGSNNIQPQVEGDAKETVPGHHRYDDRDNDEHSDDVISIEGGDLETEMSEHLDEDTKFSHSSNWISKEEEDNDIISLDSSGDEDVHNGRESWHSRYLKSSKVNKVLAVSRLGKRVRDKLKTSKLSKKNDHIGSSEKEPDFDARFTSRHEEGSVEQYKELLEMSQRKT